MAYMSDSEKRRRERKEAENYEEALEWEEQARHKAVEEEQLDSELKALAEDVLEDYSHNSLEDRTESLLRLIHLVANSGREF